MTPTVDSSLLTVHIEATFQEYNADHASSTPYVWMYRAVLKNIAPDCITLQGRSWTVVTGQGVMSCINDPGMFQEASVLSPGEEFIYVGWLALHASSGLVYGHYQGAVGQKNTVLLPIPGFSLDSDADLSVFH